MSKYPPETALEPDVNDIRAVADGLKAKPEPARLEAAYREAGEFGEYWAEVYEALRLGGVGSLENYYEDADFGEADSTLEALEAILWSLCSDIVRARRDQRAMELEYDLRVASGKTAAFTQMVLC